MTIFKQYFVYSSLPKNINKYFNFGSILGLAFILQFLSRSFSKYALYT
jgi:hypothetical protein